MPFNTNCQLQNIAPSFVACPAGPITTEWGTADNLLSCTNNQEVYQLETVNGAFSGATSLKLKELTYQITNQSLVTGWVIPASQAWVVEQFMIGTGTAGNPEVQPFYVLPTYTAGTVALYHEEVFAPFSCSPSTHGNLHSKWSITVKVTDAQGTGLIDYCTFEVWLYGGLT